jgi:hypothetical protein
MEELIAKIKEVAAKEAACDDEDFDLSDYAAGNIDDAYSVGYGHGEIHHSKSARAGSPRIYAWGGMRVLLF